MINVALKEWAGICRALATGRQSLILRKGGIAETGGVFRPEHDAFWLFPTFVHQQQGGLLPKAAPLIAESERDRPGEGLVRLWHFCRVERVEHLQTLDAAFSLDGRHLWTPETVEQRFHYRTPGLYALFVRVYAAAQPRDVPNRPEYDGCKSWVPLAEWPEDVGAKPVTLSEPEA